MAKAPDGTPPNAMPTMILNLLEDRFKLVLHVETRDMSIFNLVLRRSDGKLGPTLKPSSAKCQTMITARTAEVGGFERSPPALPGTPGGPPLFDPNNPACGSMRRGPGIAGGGGLPITRIVQILSQLTGRQVRDKTGLTGVFDFTLKYMADPGLKPIPFVPALSGPRTITSDADPDAPNLFTALQEQLGLKLESARGPVDVVVIDHVERPMPD